MKVCLIYGGRSGEHEVSLQSAASVLKHINSNKHEISLIGISHEGEWFLQDVPDRPAKSLDLFTEGERRVSLTPGIGITRGDEIIETNIVLPILHGTFGEDGTIQGLMDMMGLPYAGCDVLGSAIGMDKHVAKTLLKSADIPIVPWIVMEPEDRKNSGDIFKRAVSELGLPLFVKPSAAGSSVGASRVDTSEEWDEALADACRYGSRILIEKAVDARELECAVLGNDNLEVFGPGEIIPTHEFYDYEAKYTDPDGAEIKAAADVDLHTADTVRQMALDAFRVLKLSGLARMDFFIDRRTGLIYLNEANTMPGFTSISMYPRLCSHGGLEFGALIERIMELGLENFRKKESLSYRREIKSTV